MVWIAPSEESGPNRPFERGRRGTYSTEAMLPVWLTDTVTSDLDRAVHYTLLWGLEGMILRTVGSAESRVPNVDEEKLGRRMRENDLPVPAVQPGLFTGPLGSPHQWMNEIMLARDVFDFCERLGIGMVIVDAFAGEPGDRSPEELAEPLRELAEEAGERGVRVVVRNRTGTHVPTGSALAELLDVVDHLWVGAAWAPADGRARGESPPDGLAALGDRIQLVSAPDYALEGERAEEFAMEELLGVLHERGFEGPVSLEIETEPKPKHGLWAATELVRAIRRVTGERA